MIWFIMAAGVVIYGLLIGLVYWLDRMSGQLGEPDPDFWE